MLLLRLEVGLKLLPVELVSQCLFLLWHSHPAYAAPGTSHWGAEDGSRVGGLLGSQSHEVQHQDTDASGCIQSKGLSSCVVLGIQACPCGILYGFVVPKEYGTRSLMDDSWLGLDHRHDISLKEMLLRKICVGNTLRKKHRA